MMIGPFRLPLKNCSVTAPSALIVWVMTVHSPFKLTQNNHGVIAPSAQILLGFDSLKCQHKSRTHRPGQKLPPPGKEYLYFKMVGKTAHDSECSK